MFEQITCFYSGTLKLLQTHLQGHIKTYNSDVIGFVVQGYTFTVTIRKCIIDICGKSITKKDNRSLFVLSCAISTNNGKRILLSVGNKEIDILLSARLLCVNYLECVFVRIYFP